MNNFIEIILNIIDYVLMKRLPVSCPSCGDKLSVKRLRCEHCETEVDGLYALPALASLPQEDQEFLLQFVKASGSLKEMADILKVSYPTVRNRLDEVIAKLKQSEFGKKESK
jgi:hypothetical protein